MTLPDSIFLADTKYSRVVSEPAPLPLPAGLTLWRLLHDKELWDKGIVDPRNSKNVWYWRRGLPEVFHCDGSHVTKMTEWVQRLAYDLNQPGLTGDKFRVLFDTQRAFTNRMGFDTVHDPGEAGYEARRDYINRRDLTAEYPRFDKSHICGGATIAGRVSGSWLEVETLKVDRPVTLSWLLAHPWLYFVAVTVAGNSTPEREIVGDFPQRGGWPCLIPLVTTTAVRYPLARLEPVTQIASPYLA